MPKLYPCTGCGRLHGARGRCSACAKARPAGQRTEREKARRRGKWQEAFWRSPEHRAWRKKILARDAHTCVLCGQPGNVADHHPPLAELVQYGLDPWALEHGRTLCRPCSGRVDGARARAPHPTPPPPRPK